MIDGTQIDPARLDALNAEQLRELAARLIERANRDAQELVWRDAKIDKLTFEIAQLKRLKFGASSERISAEQRALFEESVQADIAAIEAQIEQLQVTLPLLGESETPKQPPKRQALPAHVIDKGIPTAGLLAQVLVAKHADHLPLYRQEAIFARAGMAIARSTLAAWVGQVSARTTC